MTREVAEVVNEVEPGRVFTVEDGGVWFSGMNSNVGRLVHRVARHLREEGYQVGLSFPQDRGLFLQIPDCRELENDELDSIVKLSTNSGAEVLP